MNEWGEIHIPFGRRFKTGIVTFLVTFLATITLDLTQAIIIGGILSAGIFINQVANLEVQLRPVDVERMRQRGHGHQDRVQKHPRRLPDRPTLFRRHQYLQRGLRPRRGCGLPDPFHARGAPHRPVRHRDAHRPGRSVTCWQEKRSCSPASTPRFSTCSSAAGVDEHIGKDNFFWSADRAILVAEQRHLHLSHAEFDLEGHARSARLHCHAALIKTSAANCEPDPTSHIPHFATGQSAISEGDGH